MCLYLSHLPDHCSVFQVELLELRLSIVSAQQCVQKIVIISFKKAKTH